MIDVHLCTNQNQYSVTLIHANLECNANCIIINIFTPIKSSILYGNFLYKMGQDFFDIQYDSLVTLTVFPRSLVHFYIVTI